MPTKVGAFTFEEVLPRLAVAYESGRLVPFIGVGMSRPACADWQGLIRGLERRAGIAGDPLTRRTAPDELIRRANRAVQTLRSSADGVFEQALAGALFTGLDAAVPPQMRALARIWWPLVLTTNYDDFYVRAFERSFDAGTLAVVGRGSEDCQRVLTSLTVAGRALLWAVQGHLAAPCAVRAHETDARLSAELVIDHAEYRRVTYREPHFRRAFAEVFRHRSLLFLGSGLKETYLQELFGEVLELYGPGNRTHYAIMPRGEVDPPFMHARFQIAVVEYGSNDSVDHGYVPACLEKLRAAVERTDSAPVSWSFGSVEATGAIQRGHPHLDVVRGPLPTARRKGECLVLSAGGKGDDDAFIISDALRPTLSGWRRAGHGPPAPLSPYVARLGGHAFAVRARLLGEDVKALEAVRDASTAVFDAVAPRYRTINMQLLATGGGDGANATRWSARPFPARFSFMETVRAWGEWRRAHDVSDVRLVLYVVDPSVTRELVSGRIDVLELLRCPDIGIWTEQVEGGIVVERRRFQVGDSTILATIVDELCLDPAWWNVEVSPPTSIRSGSGPRPLDGSQGETPLTRSLRSLGVVAGSTLHFRRIEQRASIAPGPAAPPSAITARRRSGRARAGR